MRYFEQTVHRFTRWLSWVAGGALVAMMLLIGIHVLLRQFGNPVLGSYEFVEVFMVILLACGLAYTALAKGHIAVNVVISRLPQRTQAIIDTVTNLISIALFAVVTWRLALYGVDLWRTGTLSTVMRWPYFQYVFLAAFGFATLCLVLLVDLLKSFSQVVKK